MRMKIRVKERIYDFDRVLVVFEAARSVIISGRGRALNSTLLDEKGLAEPALSEGPGPCGS